MDSTRFIRLSVTAWIAVMTIAVAAKLPADVSEAQRRKEATETRRKQF